MHLGVIAFLATWLELCQGNLEGPFLFFGPKSLERYERSALNYLEQDDLMKIYGEQAAIVVFNNQDSLPLSSAYFPRLEKMLDGLGILFLPQSFLDVHPDYVSNGTQVLTLQGPCSERDAQMTETFARLQDIYGAGRVLGVLGNIPPTGNSVSQRRQIDYPDSEWNRVRRDAITDPTSTQAPPIADDEKPAKALVKSSLYNATGPPGKSVLLYTAGWPQLQWPDDSVTVLSTPIGEPTIKPTRLYTIMVVRFADGDNTRDKITLEFSFRLSAGWWTAAGVEVRRGRAAGVGLLPSPASDAPSAVQGRAYRCSKSLIYAADNITLTFPNILIQPFMDSTQKFDPDAFDCVGFTTPSILSGQFAVFFILLALGISICQTMDIKPMDKFENSRGKQLTITVSE